MRPVKACRIYPMGMFAALTGGDATPPPLAAGFRRSDEWFWVGLDDTGHPVLKSTSSPKKRRELERNGFAIEMPTVDA